MSQILLSIVSFIVGISILVAVHEFGHFWVARRFGIKVLRFSIGFGRPLFRWYDTLGTEYVLSAIPFGGYVSLFGEQSQTIPPAERAMSFQHKPVWVRMLVLVAGPAFNLLFAVFAFWIVFMLGIKVMVPILGNVPKDSPAGLAGLHPGQEIVSVEGHPTPSWEAVSVQLLSHLGEDKTIELQVQESNIPHRSTIQKTLYIGQWEDSGSKSGWLESLGLFPFDPVPAVVGNVLPDLPAAHAGLVTGDKIVRADSTPISSRSDLIQYVQARPNKPIVLLIERQHHQIPITVTPKAKHPDQGTELLVTPSEEANSSHLKSATNRDVHAGSDKSTQKVNQLDSRREVSTKNSTNDGFIGFIGVEFPPIKELPPEMMRIERYGVWKSFVKAYDQTVQYSLLTLEVIKKMMTGKLSARHIGGPVAIAKYAGQSASFGLKQFLDFLAMISISLGVLNLLPIPILDGGQLVYCFYELVTGRKVSQTAMVIGLWVGGSILLAFMLLAFYNDFFLFFS